MSTEHQRGVFERRKPWDWDINPSPSYFVHTADPHCLTGAPARVSFLRSGGLAVDIPCPKRDWKPRSIVQELKTHAPDGASCWIGQFCTISVFKLLLSAVSCYTLQLRRTVWNTPFQSCENSNHREEGGNFSTTFYVCCNASGCSDLSDSILNSV